MGTDNVIRYCTTWRDGTAVHSSLYTDENRTSLDDTLDVNTVSDDFTHIVAIMGGGQAGQTKVRNGYSENLDLQEALPPPDVEINFTSPTDGNGSTITNRNHTYINVSVINNTAPLDIFIINWNGTNVTVYDDSLVLAMNLNNNTLDWSKYGHIGIVTNAHCWTNTSGKFGTACSFDGSGDYIEIPRDTSLEPTNYLTITSWVKYATATVPSSDNGIVSRKEWGSDTFGYRTYLYNNKLDFTIGNGTGNLLAYSPEYTDWNQWHYLAVVYNNGNISLYRDGKQVVCDGVCYIKPSINYATQQNVYIGSSKTTTYPFNGTIDEVRIYNRVLSEAEINASYQAELGKYYMNQTNQTNGIYTYYAFANDTSGNSNVTETRTITFGEAPDETPPQFSSNSTNNTLAGNNTMFNITVIDNALDYFIFSTNNTGKWGNSTPVKITGNTTYKAYSIAALNSTVGALIQWMFYANDTANNQNKSYAYNLTTTVYSPPADTCEYSGSGDWNIKGSDYCNLNTNTNLNGVNFNCVDAGVINVNANITNIGAVNKINGCIIVKKIGNYMSILK
jgi:hypothetical protein